MKRFALWATLLMFNTVAGSANASVGLVVCDIAADLVTVAAIGDLTNAPTMRADDTTMATTNVNPGEMKAVYYDAQDYTGSATRAYAYIGIPAGASVGSPVPGVVLVHGGGGTAFDDWVTEWTNRGYAAISIAVEGQTDTVATQQQKDDGEAVGNWLKHAMPGPNRTGIYADTAVDPITDQWMYHAVADTVLANSLLRSLPEVDASKVGLMGISWGGVIASTAIGIDNRFAFAVPTYGCGHKYDARNTYGTTLGDNEVYKQVWDPMVRITNATMPTLWYSWPSEWHFPLDCQAYTYHGTTGTRMVSIVPGWGHGHDWNRPESYDFADSVISNGTPWCVQQSVNLVGGVATAVFTSSKALTEASLLYGISNEVATIDLGWVETSVTSLVEAPADTWTVIANVPANASGWFIKVEATGSDTNDLYGYSDTNLVACSDYQEVIEVSTNATAFTHTAGTTLSTGEVSVVFSVPSNIEITDIQLGNESHEGSFTKLTSAPLTLTASPGTINVEFDNSVAGLSTGETATCTVTVTWEHLDGSTDQAVLPVSASIGEAPTSVTIDDSNIKRPEDRTGDGLGDGSGNVDFRLVGYYEHDGVENMHLVWAFQMAGVSYGGQISDADFSVTQNDRVGSAHTYDIEAHVIRTSSISDLVNSDYETSAGLLMTNFNGGAVSGDKSLDTAGESALTTYLQNNWAEGEYIIIGLKTDPVTVATYSGGGRELDDYHHYSTNAQLTVEWDPDITIVERTPTDIDRIDDWDANDAGDILRGSANQLVGYFVQDNVENMHMVWAFQMTGSPSGERIASADFNVTQVQAGGGTYTYSVDAHVIRTSSSTTIAIADYENSADLLMTNFCGTGTGPKSLNVDGKSALTSYLQDNWVEGDYVFIGLKTDPMTIHDFSVSEGTTDFYRYDVDGVTDATLIFAVLPPQGTCFIVR